jgi:D-amino peptidase
MKIFISADIEGVAGITLPEEANPDSPQVKYFQNQMTLEVAAACEGAVELGATEILVNDAHWTGCNIDPSKLPECVSLLRGWSGHPFSMMDGIDESFDSVIYIGYHSRAGSCGNPLAHTMSGRVVEEMRINDRPVSEFYMNTLTAKSVGVPVVFLSGDESLCSEVNEFDSSIETFAPLKGIGTATISVNPTKSCQLIKSGVKIALNKNLIGNDFDFPDKFKIEIDYKHSKMAYGAAFYPGCERTGEKTIQFQTENYFDILKMIKFTV